MAEYIKRNAIKERLEDLVNWCQDLRKPGLEQALAMLNEEPVADVALWYTARTAFTTTLAGAALFAGSRAASRTTSAPTERERT